jgi:hypothetical protein
LILVAGCWLPSTPPELLEVVPDVPLLLLLLELHPAATSVAAVARVMSAVALLKRI